MEPGPKFTFSRARIAPVAVGTELPEGFRVGQNRRKRHHPGDGDGRGRGWRDSGHAKARVSPGSYGGSRQGHAFPPISASTPAAPALWRAEDRRGGADAGRAHPGHHRPAGGQVFFPRRTGARERLRRTGVFKSITLAEDDRITPPDLLGITATVVEEKRRHYSFGAEIASMAGLTLSGSWMHRNLFGGGERLKIEGQVLNIGSKESGSITFWA